MWPLMLLAVLVPLGKKPYAWDAHRSTEAPIPKVFRNSFRVINLTILTPSSSQKFCYLYLPTVISRLSTVSYNILLCGTLVKRQFSLDSANVYGSTCPPKGEHFHLSLFVRTNGHTQSRYPRAYAHRTWRQVQALMSFLSDWPC